MLRRVLRAELLKLRRTLAFWMVPAAPFVVLLLSFLMFHQRSEYFAKSGKPLWENLQRNSFVLWAVLMMPLYITLQTALLAGLEHSGERWRNLLALPVRRWTLYVVKLAIPCAMVFASSAILNFGVLLSGVLLTNLKPELRFPSPLPWAQAWDYTFLSFTASLLVIAIQQWVSLRFATFAASAGFGICCTVAGSILANSQKYGPWWPWCLPVQLMTGKPEPIAHALWYSCLGGLIAAVLGGVEFCRREIRG
ncbi:MAG: ABC transporter permease [Acidobacteria bacterium]|nr:ABC transporter permease [Acidobacteriota bacterium]